MPTGPRNAITDVTGVRVGHADVHREADEAGVGVVCTGVTTIFPTADPCHEWVYVGTDVLNGYGEIIGINQLNEWGVLHSPIVLTSSLSIGLAYDATAKWMVRQDREQGGGMPVVTECDDSYLNDTTAFPLSEEAVWIALDRAGDGEVAEGCVGAGSGMQCFDFKGGIGTASRLLPHTGGYTVAALVMTNFGRREDLRIDGVPVGREIDDLLPSGHGEGSCIVVLGTDAPLLPHQLRRLAKRGSLGLARTGSNGGNGSGELMLAFSTAQTIRAGARESIFKVDAAVDGYGPGSIFSDLFTAAVEATEEAVINSLFTATTTRGRDGHTLHALPIDRTLESLERGGRLSTV